MVRLLPALCLLASFAVRAQDDEATVVFLGDSITAGWSDAMPAFFAGRPYIERGVGGETTPQILARFRADVVDLEPAAVVILAGTNDIAGNTGPATNKMIQDNLASMAEVASANDIRVILASILPAYDYPWSPGQQPAGRIAAINSWMRSYAEENGHVYLDYYSALVDDRGGMQAAYTTDGVHVNAEGYAIMAGLAETAIAEALGQPLPEEQSSSGIFFRPLDGCPRTTSSKRRIDCD
jgi:lysophospholipase L1-like esterase